MRLQYPVNSRRSYEYTFSADRGRTAAHGFHGNRRLLSGERCIELALARASRLRQVHGGRFIFTRRGKRIAVKDDQFMLQLRCRLQTMQQRKDVEVKKRGPFKIEKLNPAQLYTFTVRNVSIPFSVSSKAKGMRQIMR